jgi:hypothetical protein
MQKVLLAKVAALSVLTASAAHSAEKWEANFRRCQIEKMFLQPTDGRLRSLEKNIGSARTEMPRSREMICQISISPDEIRELEEGLAILKKCKAFWQCAADRDAGKVKHCYENDRRWRLP